jgi:hypothetical protein
MIERDRVLDRFDRLLPQHLVVRLFGAALMIGVLYLMIRGRWTSFGAITAVFGTPAGIGLLLDKRWGRLFGLLFCAVWGLLGLLFVLKGNGLTKNNLSLIFVALAGGWNLLKWRD